MNEPNVKNIVGLALHLLNAHFEGLEAAAREHPAAHLALERRGLIGPRKADSVILLERLYHALSDDMTISGAEAALAAEAR
jgi:hypothetical protein